MRHTKRRSMRTMNTQPWHWTTQRIVETLGSRVALSAMRGKPSPMAAAVLARLEGK